jgi:hypothetical protein
MPLMLRDAAPSRVEDARERAQGAAPQHEGEKGKELRTTSAHSRASGNPEPRTGSPAFAGTSGCCTRGHERMLMLHATGMALRARLRLRQKARQPPKAEMSRALCVGAA